MTSLVRSYTVFNVKIIFFRNSESGQGLHFLLLHLHLFKPIALRKAKIVNNFECFLSAVGLIDYSKTKP